MSIKNLDTKGRLIRLGIALALFAYAYQQMSYVALGFGIFTLIEASLSWCILYQILGKNSCPIDKK